MFVFMWDETENLVKLGEQMTILQKYIWIQTSVIVIWRG